VNLAMNSPFRNPVLCFAVCISSALLPGVAGSAPHPHPSPSLPQAKSLKADRAPIESTATATVPGPLRSFLRMGAISQQVTLDEVLPLLARNIEVQGYDAGKPTEFLLLFNEYLMQARELAKIAGKEQIIHISTCEEAKPLLAILGYKSRQGCGLNTTLQTEDPGRAFLTIDSGFPLSDLEASLRDNKPFDDPYPSTQIPVMFSAEDWVAKEPNGRTDLIDTLVRDPGLARLYWALSRMDSETGQTLKQSLGVRKLVASAAILDFYGSHISIRSGQVVVPGGAASAPVWKDLVGVGPDTAAGFVTRLASKDDGWLAAYFDALSRVSGAQQAYFSDPRRLKRFYEAFRGPQIPPNASRHSFRPDEGTFLLVTRLPLDPDGNPHVPGNLAVWKEILQRKSNNKLLRDWGKRASSWNSSDQLVEAMFALSRMTRSEGPLQRYLSICEIDRGRTAAQRLTPQTVKLLADNFALYGDQYLIFPEFKSLDNASITRFLTVAQSLNRTSDHLLKSDALGMFQASVGLWQIFARQGQIPDGDLNDSWQKVIAPYASAQTAPQLFDAGRASFTEIAKAVTGKPELSQADLIALLAGPAQRSVEGRQIRGDMASRIRSVMDDQRLVSLDTLFALDDGLAQMVQGKPASDRLTALAAELREFEMPKPLFTMRERTELAAGVYNIRHTAMQMRSDVGKIISSPVTAEDAKVARGQMAPFLRDTLVGLNYAYYEPPGAQMLHHNPLFVRSHDFSGGDFSGAAATASQQAWETPRLYGRGWAAGGGAHLVGSLADLPYVLAKVEQDFIVPNNVQSLIWEDLVPGLMTSAVVPRWWGVTPDELHAVALYQRSGEELITASASDEKLRETVMGILSDRMLPQRSELVEQAIIAGHAADALAQVMPAESFYLAAEYRRRFTGEISHWGQAGNELEQLSQRNANDVSVARLSRDFGVPHPALAFSNSRELLNVKPFPAFMDYSSRLLAESWDSSNLYWARIADEMGYSPEMLNRLVPQLTLHMVERTFASHLEDWPAVARAMHETGDEFRQGKIAALPKAAATPGGD
jgi:hypothetical protein